MKKRGIFIALCIAMVSVHAQSYKCKQENGQYLFSGTPCTPVSQILEKIQINYDNKVVSLSITAEPTPLPNGVVENLLDSVGAACGEKDGQKILSYFSKGAQTKLSARVINGNTFSTVSYACSNVKNIKREIAISKEPILFASKKPYKSIELCLYTAKKGLENCLGNTQIVAEKGILKLDVL